VPGDAEGQWQGADQVPGDQAGDEHTGDGQVLDDQAARGA
jgi:hypothetical protein